MTPMKNDRGDLWDRSTDAVMIPTMIYAKPLPLRPATWLTRLPAFGFAWVLITAAPVWAQYQSEGTGPGTLLQTPRMQGLAQPSQQVRLTSIVPGLLETITPEEGDHVEAGQVVAQIDAKVQQQVVAAARLQAQSKTGIELAKLSLDISQMRYEQLKSLESGVATQWEIEQARIEMEQALAQVRAAEEAHDLAVVNLQLEEQRLALYSIRAPFAGEVIRVQVEPGVSLDPEDPILGMANLLTLEAHLYVPLKWFNQLQVGQNYTLLAGEPASRQIVGRLKNIDPIVDPASRAFRAVFEIDNADRQLPAGFELMLLGPDAADAPAPTPLTDPAP